MLHLQTVFIYTAAINLFIVAAATIGWIGGRQQPDMKYWFLSIVFIVSGGVLLGAVEALPPLLTGYIAGMVYVASTGFLRLGMKAFFNQPFTHSQVLWPAVTVGAAIVVIRLVSGGEHDGVFMLYVGSAINLGLAALAVRRGTNGKMLRSQKLTSFILGIYSLGNIIVAPFAYWDQITFVDGMPVSNWLGITSIPLELLTMTTFLMVVVLKLERVTESQRHLATHDGLTEILNRRAFYDELEGLADQSGVLAIIDIDHFKAVNDTHGHQSGDEVLRSFAQFAKDRLPEGSVFGRLGGEEFGLLFAGIDQEAARALLEDLRTESAAMLFESRDGTSFSVTISCGYTALQGGHWDVDQKVAEVDRALYFAKDCGRNRVVAAHDGQVLARQLSTVMRSDQVEGPVLEVAQKSA